jgi:hypothetical protein
MEATAQQSLAAILSHKGKFVTVSFRRKTKGRNGEPVGSIRTMQARLHVRKHVTGVLAPGVRKAEDKKHSVLTVWDVQAFHAARREGKALRQAGKAAYRRINLLDVVSIGVTR